MNRKLTRGIRITRIVALAMVAAPEPVSTALGLGILGILTIPMLILRRQNARTKLYLRRILTEYAHTYRPFGFGMGYIPTTSTSLPYRFKEPLYNIKEKPNISPLSEISTNTRPQVKAVYHSFDRELALKRLEKMNSQQSIERSYIPIPQADIKQPIHHTFDRVLAAERFNNGGSRTGYVGYWGRRSYIEVKPVYHSTAMSLN